MAEKPTYKELEKRIQELEQAESEHERIEKSLREDLIRFQLLYERAPLGYQSLDEDGNVINANRAWLDILGYSREEVIGKSFSKFLHPDWKDHFKNHFPRFKAIGEVLGIEFEMVKKDGSSILVSFNGKIGKDKYGGFMQTHCIFQNITEHRRLEEALRESEEWHKNFLENLSDVVYETDNSGNITYVNKIIESIIDMPLKDIIGKPFLPFFDKKSQEIAVDVYLKTLIGESPEYELTFNNGKIAHFKNKPLKNKDGKIIGVFGIARDVTALKMAKAALSKTNERLEKQVKERTSELKERNTALKVLLDQRKNDKAQMEKTIMLNIKKLIAPSLARLKKSALNGRQKSELAILGANLNEIISPFELSLSSEYLKLTPTEIQVANFIKHNATSKEIANSMGLSRRTIDTHRHSIRKKVGIRGKGVNLKTYLSSLT